MKSIIKELRNQNSMLEDKLKLERSTSRNTKKKVIKEGKIEKVENIEELDY